MFWCRGIFVNQGVAGSGVNASCLKKYILNLRVKKEVSLSRLLITIVICAWLIKISSSIDSVYAESYSAVTQKGMMQSQIMGRLPSRWTWTWRRRTSSASLSSHSARRMTSGTEPLLFPHNLREKWGQARNAKGVFIYNQLYAFLQCRALCP